MSLFGSWNWKGGAWMMLPLLFGAAGSREPLVGGNGYQKYFSIIPKRRLGSVSRVKGVPPMFTSSS